MQSREIMRSGKLAATGVAMASALLLASCASGSPSNPSAEPTEPEIDFPTRAIEMIVPFAAGGSTDPIGRIAAQLAAEELGEEINVVNRPGAGGITGMNEGVAAAPDGYTIVLATGSPLTLIPLVEDTNFRTPGENYTPIGKLAHAPLVLTVRADAPWQTIEEFIEDAEQRPGEIRVSNSGARTQPDLAVEFFNQEAGVELRSVPFSGGAGEAVIGLLGGQVEANIGNPVSVVGQVEAGDLRVLTVFQDEPVDLFPDAPPASDVGIDISLNALYTVIGPPDMPAEIVEVLGDAFEKATATETFREFAATNGYVVEWLGSDALENEIVSQMELQEALLTDLGETIISQ